MSNAPEQIVSSVYKQVLDLPPSCVEFCLVHPSYLLVGTYDLEKEDSNDAAEAKDIGDEPRGPRVQSRNGSILVFRLDDDDSLELLQTEMQPSAVLDLHFNPVRGHQDMCGAVSSTATLALYKLSQAPDHQAGEGKPLQHIRTLEAASLSGAAASSSEEVLFTSFCWHPTLPSIMAISTTGGLVHLVELGDPSGAGGWAAHRDPILAHTLEAWCVAIAPAPAGCDFTLLSGGDDSMLRSVACSVADHSAAAPASSSPPRYAVATKASPLAATGHDAGVTAILPLPLLPAASGRRRQFMVTGSYDDKIRLLCAGDPSGADCRFASLAEEHLGGGIWRLKLLDLDAPPATEGGCFRRIRLLVSCMHAGARVVDLVRKGEGRQEEQFGFEVVARFEEHQSMNYGSDAQPARGEARGRGRRVVSTSFYDRLLCLWKTR